MKKLTFIKGFYKKPIFLILVVALLVRITAAVYVGNEVSGLSGAFDEISYSLLGERFVQGYGLTFPEAWYPWYEANAQQSYYSATMSLFLAGIYWVFGYSPLAARLVMAILSTLIVGMIYLLARRYWGERVGLAAALIAALYGYLIFYGVTLVTETPFILAMLVALYISLDLIRNPNIWKWVSLGLALAIAILFRMAVVFFVPFLLGWIAIQRTRKEWKFILIPICMMVLAVLPFTIRNYVMWGRFMLLESQFGHVFWNGNHPDHQGTYWAEVFPIPDDVLSSKNDAIITNRLLRMGIENVVKDPGHFLYLTFARLREFFKFWPTSDSTLLANALRVLSFGLMWPFAVIGLWISRWKWRTLLPLYLFLLIHTGVYAISWTMTRYRLPVDAALMPFAALTFRIIVDKLWKK